MRRLGFLLLFIILISIPVSAQVASTPSLERKGGYISGPYDSLKNITNQNLTYTQGATNTLSFWDLPLWVQIACAVQALIALFVFIKIVPIVISRLSTLHKNKKAKRVMKYVMDYPGSTITQISKETNIKRDTVKYYIYQFISRNEIILEKIGRYSLLFKAPVQYDIFEKKVISYLHDDKNSKILWEMIESPGVTNVELSEKFGLNKSTIHWYIKRFQKDMIVTYKMQGNFKKYYMDEKAEKIIRDYYKGKDNR